MKSSILTSTKSIATLKVKKRKRKEPNSKLPARKVIKRTVKISKQPLPSATDESSEEDGRLLYHLFKNYNMASSLTKFNSIAYNECKRKVHLKCIQMCDSWYTYPQCNSDDSDYNLFWEEMRSTVDLFMEIHMASLITFSIFFFCEWFLLELFLILEILNIPLLYQVWNTRVNIGDSSEA